MIGCLRTHVRKQPIIVFYFEFETVLTFYNLGTWLPDHVYMYMRMREKYKLNCPLLGILLSQKNTFNYLS